MVTKFYLKIPDNFQQKYHYAVLCICYTSQAESAKTKSYCPNAYSRIGNSNILILGVRLLEIGPILTGRRLPTWEVSSCPTMVSVPMQLQGAYTTSQ